MRQQAPPVRAVSVEQRVDIVLADAVPVSARTVEQEDLPCASGAGLLPDSGGRSASACIDGAGEMRKPLLDGGEMLPTLLIRWPVYVLEEQASNISITRGLTRVR